MFRAGPESVTSSNPCAEAAAAARVSSVRRNALPVERELLPEPIARPTRSGLHELQQMSVEIVQQGGTGAVFLRHDAG